MSWTVRSVMTRDVETVLPDTPYKEIVERMRARGVSALPVIDGGGHVIGLVSEADLLLKEEKPQHLGWPLAGPGGDAAKAMARDAAAVMTSPAVVISAEATLTKAARLMHQRKVRSLPVVDVEGRLTGVISRGDVLSAFARSDESIATELRQEVLSRTLAIDPTSIAVSVDEGVVRLEGELETRSLGRILNRLVQGVEGVVGVEDRLRWTLDDTHTHGNPPATVNLAVRLRNPR